MSIEKVIRCDICDNFVSLKDVDRSDYAIPIGWRMVHIFRSCDPKDLMTEPVPKTYCDMVICDKHEGCSIIFKDDDFAVEDLI